VTFAYVRTVIPQLFASYKVPYGLHGMTLCFA